MDLFEFYLEQKVMVRERTKLTVKANSYHEAEEHAKSVLDRNYLDDESDTITFHESELLVETCEAMTVRQNKGVATAKLFTPDDHLIATNKD